MAAIPYRIETPRLVIRCLHPTDAGLMQTAISESLMHLRPWMPWAQAEPISMEARVSLLRQFRAQFDSDQDYTFGIFDPQETRLLGGSGLHKRRGPQALEVGYWIHVAETGKGLATEVTRALTEAAFALHGVRWVELRCDPQNLASQAVPRKLGFSHEATLKQRDTTALGELRDTMVWSLFKADYQAQTQAEIDTRYFDATGAEISIAR